MCLRESSGLRWQGSDRAGDVPQVRMPLPEGMFSFFEVLERCNAFAFTYGSFRVRGVRADLCDQLLLEGTEHFD